MGLYGNFSGNSAYLCHWKQYFSCCCFFFPDCDVLEKLVFSFLDIRRRIELLQDFEMPIASTNILVSSDKQYIMSSGEVWPGCHEFKDSISP